MEDREMLELAAKAAGLDLEWCEPWQCMAKKRGVLDGYDRLTCWYPIRDDGDALRLAVKLNLTIKIIGDHVKVGWIGCGERWPGEEAPTPSELLAATRRAIVRAAAEIGKQMG